MPPNSRTAGWKTVRNKGKAIIWVKPQSDVGYGSATQIALLKTSEGWILRRVILDENGDPQNQENLKKLGKTPRREAIKEARKYLRKNPYKKKGVKERAKSKARQKKKEIQQRRKRRRDKRVRQGKSRAEAAKERVSDLAGLARKEASSMDATDGIARFEGRTGMDRGRGGSGGRVDPYESDETNPIESFESAFAGTGGDSGGIEEFEESLGIGGTSGSSGGIDDFEKEMEDLDL
ncbi:MAG: hypothetical protein SV253_09065 [Halobacteria archaeon]|nr:hypothetical protein [Halobacteria archaeon]